MAKRNQQYNPEAYVMGDYLDIPSTMAGPQSIWTPDDPPYYAVGGNVIRNGTPRNAGGAGIIPNLFANLRARFGAGKSLLGKPGFDLSSLKNLGRDFRATQLFEGQPKLTLGNIGAAGMGAYQGIKAIKGFTDNVQSDNEYHNLINDIKSAAYSNPMASQYLTADQNRLLRQARTGSLDVGNWGGAAAGAMQGIPKALLSTLIGGIAGGPIGAALGGLGSLGNSAIQGYGNRTREQNDKLSGLYSALQNAEMNYRDESNQRIRNRHFSRMY